MVQKGPKASRRVHDLCALRTVNVYVLFSGYFEAVFSSQPINHGNSKNQFHGKCSAQSERSLQFCSLTRSTMTR